MKKLCLFFNIAPHYREAIYHQIDKEYNCDWYFGDNRTDIKTMNYQLLNNVHWLKTYQWRNAIIYQKGLLRLLFDKNYSTYLVIGEPRNISIWLLLIFKRLLYPNKRIYTWSHGNSGKRKGISQHILNIFSKLSNGIFLYSNYAKNIMVNRGVNPDKLFVIHNSLDYDKQITIRNKLKPSSIYTQHYDNNNKNIIFIGRLTKIKRLDILLYAIKHLKDKNININLTLVGDGVSRGELLEIVNKLEINKQVWFYGECYNEEENGQLIYNADVCVSPGNVGLTSIHSLTYGTPVITNDNFAYQMPEFEAIIDGVTGAFYHYDDYVSLSDAIEKWLYHENYDREYIRNKCYEEIDMQWTPYYQMEIIRKNLIINK